MKNRPVVRPSILVAGVIALLFACAWSGVRWYNARTRHAASEKRVVAIPEPGVEESAGSRLDRFNSGRATVAAILAKADRIEPFLIEPVASLAGGGIENYKVIFKGNRLGSELAQSLTTLVLEPKSYTFSDDVKMCLFQPRVAFRAWHDQQYVDVLICFDCLQMQFVIPNRGDSAQPTLTSDWYDIDPAAHKLRELIRQAFPKITEVDRALNLVPRV